MAHTPGMPAHWSRQIERVRNDGQWLVGDRLDMDYRPWRIDGRTVNAVPRLHLERWSDAAPPPIIPGWEFHRFSGIGDPSRMPTPGNPVYIRCLEYTPTECNDPTRPPEQLALF